MKNMVTKISAYIVSASVYGFVCEISLENLTYMNISSRPPKSDQTRKFSSFAVSGEKMARTEPAEVVKPANVLQAGLHPRPWPPSVQFCWPNRTKYVGTCKLVNALSRVKFYPKCHWTGTRVAGIRPNSSMEL
jgi:hypothetical protein